MSNRHVAQIEPNSKTVLNVIEIPANTADVEKFCSVLVPGYYAWQETFMDTEAKPKGAFKNYAGVGQIADLLNGFISKPAIDAVPDTPINAQLT